MSGRGLLDPPESTTSDMDSDQELSSGAEASRLKCATAGAAYGNDVLMKIPRVVRTYTRKIKHASPVREDDSALSPNRPVALLDRLLDDGSDAPTKQLVSRIAPQTKAAKKRKQQTLQISGEACREVRSEDEADMVTSEKNSKTKRKKRRAPVSQLALVAITPFHEASRLKAPNTYDSGNAVDPLDEYGNEQVSPISTSPSYARSQKMRANVGKPVTRIRKELAIPHQEALDRRRFKVLPITPRPTKPPGWRLGSGFDGITLEPLGSMRPRTSRSRNVGGMRTPRYLDHSFPKLEFSTELSPTRDFVGRRGIPERQKNHCGSVEKSEPTRRLNTINSAFEGGLAQRAADIGERAASEQLANMTAPYHPPIKNDQSRKALFYHNVTVKKAIQVHSSQSNIAASQTIREPSKSERNGWLKRKRVAFAVSDEDEGRLPARTQITSVNGSEHGRKSGKACLKTRFKDASQTQHAAENDLQAFHRGGHTTQEPERSVTSQKQKGFRGEPSAVQHRRRVSHDVEVESLYSEDEASNYQSLNRPPEPQVSLEPDFPSSGIHPTGLPMPKARYSIDPRTSEVPETQDILQESIEIDHMRIEPVDFDRHPFQISEMTIDNSKYFSKAVQQLDSPETGPHIIMRRKSRREPSQEGRGSPVTLGTQRGLTHHVNNVAPFIREQRNQEPEGIFQLGVTPRLKRRMSNVRFKPPFRESF